VSAELVTIISSRPFFGGENFLHTVAVSARYSGDRLRPFLNAGVPLDKSAEVDFFLSAGLQAILD
jgi:hypothetical protein